MIARVLRVEVRPDRVDSVIAAYRDKVRPIHERAAGLRSHYVLADRDRGAIQIIGLWESPDAVLAVADVLEPARQALWALFGEAPALEVYDVADAIDRTSG